MAVRKDRNSTKSVEGREVGGGDGVSQQIYSSVAKINTLPTSWQHRCRTWGVSPKWKMLGLGTWGGWGRKVMNSRPDSHAQQNSASKTKQKPLGLSSLFLSFPGPLSLSRHSVPAPSQVSCYSASLIEMLLLWTLSIFSTLLSHVSWHPSFSCRKYDCFGPMPSLFLMLVSSTW